MKSSKKRVFQNIDVTIKKYLKDKGVRQGYIKAALKSGDSIEEINRILNYYK